MTLIVQGWVDDTLVRHHAIWPDEPKSLAFMSHTYLDTPPWKPPRKLHGADKFDSFEDLARYNARDCINTLRLVPELHLEQRAEGIGDDLVELDLYMQKIAVEMSEVGIPVDTALLDEVGIECGSRARGHAFRFCELAGRNVNLASPKQIQEVLYRDWGLPVPKKTEKGIASTDVDALRQIQDQHEGVGALLGHRKYAKLADTYIQGWRTLVRDGRLHPSWKACAQVAGRWSCSPNLMSVPFELRRLVRPRNGRVLFGADMAALEFRGTGALSGGDLFEFLNKPEDDARKYDPTYDPHSLVSAMVFGPHFTEAPKDKKKKLRDTIKRVVYGRNYRAGPPTIFEVLRKDMPGLSLPLVTKIVAAYDQRFPEVGEFARRSLAQAEIDRALFSPILRRRRSFLYGDIPPTDAANYPIQSLAADIMNIATKRLFDLLFEQVPSARLILQVHDQLVGECDERDTDLCVAITNDCMKCTYDLGFGPMLFDANAHVAEDWRFQ